MPIKVLCCGGRDYADRENVDRCLNKIHTLLGIDCIIHGDAVGADKLAGAWALNRNIAYVAMAAQWDKYGKAAGPIRNAEMIKEQPHLVVAFPGGRGTADMVQRAQEAGIPVVLCPSRKNG